MDAKKAKIFLVKNDLTVAEIARRVAPQTDATVKSLEVMIGRMIHGKAFYPSLADIIYREIGLRLMRPAYFAPLPSRLAA